MGRLYSKLWLKLMCRRPEIKRHRGDLLLFGSNLIIALTSGDNTDKRYDTKNSYYVLLEIFAVQGLCPLVEEDAQYHRLPNH